MRVQSLGHPSISPLKFWIWMGRPLRFRSVKSFPYATVESPVHQIRSFERNFRSPSEPVLQTVEIPASLLLKKNGRFDAAKIGSVVFRFDRSRKE